MNAALCDFSICGTLEKHLLTYLFTYKSYSAHPHFVSILPCEIHIFASKTWWNSMGLGRRYASACCDLDLWSQKLIIIISTSQNPNISVTKIRWNSLHWLVRYGVHKVSGSLPAVTLTFWPNQYVPGPGTYVT